MEGWYKLLANVLTNSFEMVIAMVISKGQKLDAMLVADGGLDSILKNIGE